jgi:co-chaperonin GroES (HSP10)
MLSDAEVKKFVPLHGHVLLRIDSDPDGEFTPSGILIIPKKADDRIMRVATVAALGPCIVTKKKIEVPHELEVGMKVVFDYRCGTVVHSDSAKGIEHRVVSTVPYCQIEGVLDPSVEGVFLDSGSID